MRDRPLQLDRDDDVLKGKPVKKSLKIIRNARLPSGKVMPLRALPLSEFAKEPYEDPKDFTVGLREGEPENFAGRTATGEPLDFATHIHRELLYPKPQTILGHTPIRPLSQAEKTGARWLRASSS